MCNKITTICFELIYLPTINTYMTWNSPPTVCLCQDSLLFSLAHSRTSRPTPRRRQSVRYTLIGLCMSIIGCWVSCHQLAKFLLIRSSQRYMSDQSVSIHYSRVLSVRHFSALHILLELKSAYHSEVRLGAINIQLVVTRNKLYIVLNKTIPMNTFSFVIDTLFYT